MPKGATLYAEVLEFEDSALGKYLKAYLAKDRSERIDALIHYGKLSTDKTVARIAWAIDTTDRMMTKLDEIKMEFDSKPPSEKDETPHKSAYPEYTSPVIAGVSGEMEYTP